MTEDVRDQLYTTLLDLLRRESQQAAALVVFLASEPKITRDRRFMSHADAAAGRIDWAGVFGERGWSSTEQVLLTAAAWLSDGDVAYDPAKLDLLDERQNATVKAMFKAHNETAVPENLIRYR